MCQPCQISYGHDIQQFAHEPQNSACSEIRGQRYGEKSKLLMPLYATYYATLCHFSIFHQTVISYGKSIENNAVIKKYDCDLRVLQAIVAETDNSGNGKVGMVKVGTAKWKQWKRKQWKQFL